jgi:hypothetical protein
MTIKELQLPRIQYIEEGYFGAEIEPMRILETEFGKIYVGKLIFHGEEKFVFYSEDGTDPVELSSIDIQEFEKALEVNKRRRRLQSVFNIID